MKKLCFLFHILPLLCVCSLSAQVSGKQITPLQIGDAVPDLVFRTMVNYPHRTAKLSDFAGKPVILDFWAHYCSSCASAFPTLQELQRRYADELKILLVSSSSREGIARFYKNAPDFDLPTAYYGTKDVIAGLFPYREVPHYVWIDRDRKIVAITNSTELTEKNIEDFLQGKKMDVRMKNDAMKWGNHSGAVLDSVERSGRANMISVNPKIVFQSMIMRHDPRLTHVRNVGQRERADRYYTFQNASVVHLLQYALGYGSSRDNWRFYLDLSDSTFTYLAKESPPEYRRTWSENHSYTYRIILDRPDSARLRRIMQRDLEATFGIRSVRKQIEVPYLVLRSTADREHLMAGSDSTGYSSYTAYNITLRNRPIGDLVNALYRLEVGNAYKLKNQQRMAVFDRTGITGKVDIDIGSGDLQDMQRLQGRLRDYGLDLVVETGELEMIVLTDR